MSKPRFRIRRTLLLLVLLVLLALLLELNRWLPGTWPGGGGSGWMARALPTPTRADDDPARTELAEAPDVRVAAPAARSPDTTRDPLPEASTIELRILDAAGRPVSDATLGAGGAGALDLESNADGVARVRRDDVRSSGVRIRRGAHDVRHVGSARASDDALWIVHLPSMRTPPLKTFQERTVRFEDGLADVRFEVLAPDGEVLARLASDENGLARIERTLDVVRLRFPDRPGADSPWISLREPEPAVVRPDARRSRTRIVVDPDGSVRIETTGTPTGEEIGVWWDDPVHGVKLAWKTTDDPSTLSAEATRLLTVPLRVTSERPIDADTPWTVEVSGTIEAGTRDDVANELTVTRTGQGPLESALVPAGLTNPHALVQVAGRGPVWVELDTKSEDGTAISLAPGAMLDVDVTLAPGVDPATLVVEASASIDDRRPFRLTDRSTSAGPRRLGPLPSGAVDVLVHAHGAVPVATSTTVASGESRSLAIELREQGHALHLKVHTVAGLPIEGARVVLSTEDVGPPLLLPERYAERRTDADGFASFPAILPDRPLRIQVEAADLRTADIRNVRPGPGLHLLTLAP